MKNIDERADVSDTGGAMMKTDSSGVVTSVTIKASRRLDRKWSDVSLTFQLWFPVRTQSHDPKL